MSTKGTTDTHYSKIHFDDMEQVYTFATMIGSGWKYLTQSVRKHPELIRERVDGLVEEVGLLCNKAPNIHVDIYLYWNEGEVQEKARELSHDLHLGTKAFYQLSTNSIHVSAKDCTRDVLAHEFVHAYGFSEAEADKIMQKF